jgi:hypothetical protein
VSCKHTRFPFYETFPFSITFNQFFFTFFSFREVNKVLFRFLELKEQRFVSNARVVIIKVLVRGLVFEKIKNINHKFHSRYDIFFLSAYVKKKLGLV